MLVSDFISSLDFNDNARQCIIINYPNYIDSTMNDLMRSVDHDDFMIIFEAAQRLKVQRIGFVETANDCNLFGGIFRNLLCK